MNPRTFTVKLLATAQLRPVTESPLWLQYHAGLLMDPAGLWHSVHPSTAKQRSSKLHFLNGQWSSIVSMTHLVDGGLLNEPGRIGGQEAMSGHDVDLIGASLLQDVCGRYEVLHVVYDIILGKWRYITAWKHAVLSPQSPLSYWSGKMKLCVVLRDETSSLKLVSCLCRCEMWNCWWLWLKLLGHIFAVALVLLVEQSTRNIKVIGRDGNREPVLVELLLLGWDSLTLSSLRNDDDDLLISKVNSSRPCLLC